MLRWDDFGGVVVVGHMLGAVCGMLAGAVVAGRKGRPVAGSFLGWLGGIVGFFAALTLFDRYLRLVPRPPEPSIPAGLALVFLGAAVGGALAALTVRRKKSIPASILATAKEKFIATQRRGCDRRTGHGYPKIGTV